MSNLAEDKSVNPSFAELAAGLMLYSTALRNVRDDLTGLESATAANARRQVALETIDDYGLDKPRMQMIVGDRDLNLAEQTATPSVEAFDLVAASMKDSRTQQVREVLSSNVMTDKQLLAAWMERVIPHVESLMSATSKWVEPGLKMGIEAVYGKIEQDGSEGAIGVARIGADDLGERLEMLSTLLADINPMNVDLQIVDSGHRKMLTESFAKMATDMGDVLHVRLSKEGYLEYTDDAVVDGDVVYESLAALGYTKDVTNALVDRAADVIDKLHGVLENQNAIIVGLDTANIALESLDAQTEYTMKDHQNLTAGYVTLLTSAIAAAAETVAITTSIASAIAQPA